MKAFALAFFYACVASPVLAATFNVSPIRVDLSPRKPTLPLAITNDSDEAIVIQAQVVHWVQDKAEDIYTDTNEVLATPPIFTVPAHGTQIVRVGLRRAFDHAKELSYRLYLTEIPGAAKSESIGIQMRLRIALPIFASSASTAPLLKWTIFRQRGVQSLEVRNEGNSHALISNVRLVPTDSDTLIARQPTPAYLLPGTTREWPLKLESGKIIGPEAIRLQAYVDAGDVNIELTPNSTD